jgi:hypothetical protein
MGREKKSARRKKSMRRHITTVLLVGALTAVPLVGFAASGKVQQPAASAAGKPASVATHATRGVVKSVDAKTLVITRADKKNHEMTFTLEPSTHRQGTVAVGAPVSVRYREDGKTLVATGVTVHRAKQQAAQKESSKR